MIKNLRFIAGNVQIDMVPRNLSQPMEDVEGRLRPIGPKIASGGFDRVSQKIGYTVLRIKKEYYDDLFSALSWCCSDVLNFSFTKFKHKNNQTLAVQHEEEKGFLLIECPGRFTADGKPELSTDDLHQLVNDYRLLSSHYPEYRDLTKAEIDPKLSQVLFNVLIERVIEGKKSEVPEYALRALEVKRSITK